jgi:Transposase DDE domain
MSPPLTFDSFVQRLHHRLDQLPDHRRGTNTIYAIKDAALGAFAVFFTQSPSFLAHQRRMQDATGRSNAQTLFGIDQTPTDPHIRNLLDPLAPTELFPLFPQILAQLDQAGALARYRDVHETLLVPLDGTQYFSSQQIHCPQCSQRTLPNGTTQYSHTVITPLVVKPGLPHVLPLEPIFIEPQDGATKQDCEQTAAKRWVQQYGAAYAAYHVTLLGDDLYCHQPLCQAVRDQQLNFIFVCKPDSHVHLYEWLAFLAAAEPLPTLTRRQWNGRFVELWTYRFVNGVPLRASDDAMLVNWGELIITRQDTGEQLYHNAFATNYELTVTTIESVVQAGRTRWKVENEGNNVLKNRGYHLEHNFGHGQRHLAAFLLTLNLLAFLFHTVLHLVDTRYQALRAHLVARQTFFNDVQTLTRYLCFASWDHLLTFMMTQLELSIPPAPT